jgi:hypothetical protein
MKLTQPYKTLPESILKMILQEFIKENISFDDMETVYQETGTFEDISTILKKFGITEVDYEDIGFFAELFMLNGASQIENQLTIPKPKKFNLSFRVTGRKWFTEWYSLDYTAYSSDFVRDMFDNGDLSYYDGELVDEDTNDTEVDDWELRDIEEVKPKIGENKSKKTLLESKEMHNKELRELRKLKMVVEERIRLLTP